MSEAMNRREFLSGRGLGQMLRKAAPLLKLIPESFAADPLPEVHAESAEPKKEGDDERTVMDGYLSSPLYSYALLSEMPWDMLVDEAQRYGIPYEGRSKMDVVRELFTGSGKKEGGTR